MQNNDNNLNHGVLTIATGKPEYKEMARNLARSLRRFSPDIKLAVVTDDATLSDQFDIIIPVDWSRGKSFLQKLHIDEYTPFRCTLFIDCDCIVFRDISYVFDVFAGGQSIVTTDVYELSARKPRDIDFQKMTEKIHQNWLYGFNGGAYYVERNTLSQAIFEEGRRIAKNFDAYGIPVFRENEPNDEYILAASMAHLNAPLIPCWRQLLQIPVGLEGPFKIDVIRGTASFEIYGKNCRPAIVHFCGYFREWPEYIRECKKLKTLANSRGSESRARLSEYLYSCERLVNRLYRCIPRPLRLLSHAILNRFPRKLTTNLIESKIK